MVAKLEDRYLRKAKRLVADRFPEMAGAKHSVSRKRSQSKGPAGGSSGSGSSAPRAHYVLTFQKNVSLPGGRTLKRLVRLTMDDRGEVVRLTSSK